MTHGKRVKVVFWSRGGTHCNDPALRRPQDRPGQLRFEAERRFYAGRLQVPGDGSLVMHVHSPRPLRIWVGGTLVLDEGLMWRLYERHLRAVVVVPCRAGACEILVEAGPRSTWHEGIDRDCPSRNRERVRRELKRRLPDRLGLTCTLASGVRAPATSLRFMTAQYVRDGVVWQHVLARPVRGFATRPPSTDYWSPVEEPEEPLFLRTSILPAHAVEGTSVEEKERGLRHFFVPVANPHDSPPPMRLTGEETRIEPSFDVARMVALTLEGAGGTVTCDMPAYESMGRLAPQREFRALAWPTCDQARPRLPEPVLPEKWTRFRKLYDAAWEMLFGLVRHPRPESGLPNSYIGTAAKGFLHHQFVWDSSFTAMATAYGWRMMHASATLDVLYSRQFDGGYIHREHDVRDGVPAAYEPDFSPNPPIMSVAEWAIAGLTGDRLRLAKVYEPLCQMHRWLKAHRRLADGTYWTTGLANGLDNSPSLGDGYPCLTAQMAHDADILGKIARVIGRERDARAWEAEHRAIGRALNARLWNESMQIYSTSLPGGGHNTNKVVTAFWPLWADAVPPRRVQALAQHLKDPTSFWRHHPIPSLAADSPFFRPAGDYWLGSTWAPTNFAAIKGFDRAGRHDLATETTVRHLDAMLDVLNDTGHIWENYCSEASRRGSWSGPDYCWSASGPIALLIEVLLGLQPDALNERLQWTPPDEPLCGIRNLPLGPATITVQCSRKQSGARSVDVHTDRAFTLDVLHRGKWHRQACTPGHARIALV